MRRSSVLVAVVVCGSVVWGGPSARASPDHPVLQVGGDLFWGGDGLGRFGIRPRLNLRLGRVELLGRAMLPFASAQDEIIHLTFDEYMHVSAGVAVSLWRRYGRLGQSRREILDQRDYGSYREVTYRNVTDMFDGLLDVQLEGGIGYGQECTLQERQAVGVPQIYAGPRVTKYFFGTTERNMGIQSYYLHLLRATDFEYPDGVLAAGHKESAWGVRFGGDGLVRMTSTAGLSVGLEMGFAATARTQSALPVFRMFLSLGAVWYR